MSKRTAIQSTFKIKYQDGTSRESVKYIIPSKTKYGFTLSNEPYYFTSVKSIKEKIVKNIKKYYEDRHGTNHRSDIVVNFIDEN